MNKIEIIQPKKPLEVTTLCDMTLPTLLFTIQNNTLPNQNQETSPPHKKIKKRSIFRSLEMEKPVIQFLNLLIIKDLLPIAFFYLIYLSFVYITFFLSRIIVFSRIYVPAIIN